MEAGKRAGRLAGGRARKQVGRSGRHGRPVATCLKARQAGMAGWHTVKKAGQAGRQKGEQAGA